MSLIEDGETGLLTPPNPASLADALLVIANAPLVGERLRRAGLDAVRRRTWEHSLEALATGYRLALGDPRHAARMIA